MRHYPLDFVRGAAAVGVAIYHWLLFNAGKDIQSLGTFAVYLFFVLSALTMAMVYEADFSQGLTREKVGRFIRNRVARLAPLLILVAVASAVLWGHADRAALTGSGLFGLALPGFLSTATGAWSLGVELVFYALLPVLLLLNLSKRVLIGLTVGLIAAQMLYLGAIRDMEPHWHYYTVFLTFAPYFALGMLAYRVGGERSAWFAIPALGGMVTIATFSLMFDFDLFRDRLAHLGLMLVCGMTVYFAFVTELPARLNKPAEMLGNCSYSLYLTHPFVALVVGRFGFVPYLVAALAVAYLTFVLFERPARRIIRDGFSAQRIPSLKKHSTK